MVRGEDGMCDHALSRLRLAVSRVLAGVGRAFRSRATAAVLPIALIAVGCGSGTSKLVNPIATDGSITIEISRSSTPEFTWESGVEVHAINVSNFGPTGKVDRILWGYRSISVKPPITYGTSISGGISLGVGSPAPLQSGVRYRVEVVRDNAASYADWVVP